MKYHVLFVCLSAVFAGTESANILGIFPFPVKSHHILGSTLLLELAARGHNVTMISCFPLKSPPVNYHDVYIDDFFAYKKEIMGKFYGDNATLFTQAEAMFASFTMTSTVTLRNGNVLRFLENAQEFDMVIQLWALTESLLGIGNKLNATTVAFSPFGTSSVSSYATNAPSPYAYVPNTFLWLTDEMSFFERVLNTITYTVADLVVYFVHMPLQRGYLKQVFPEAPPLDELMDDVDLFLFNSHPSIESPRPYMPNMIQIGGFHLQQQQTLPEDLQTFLDASKKGVVYFSFGTNVPVEHLNKKLLDALIKGLGSLEYDVLWKFDVDIPNLPANFKAMKWLPQLAVLNHPKVKLFVTHGGLGSTVEAIYNGVPMVVIPFIGDQDKNAADIAERKLGVRLHKDTLTSTTLTAAIKEVLENPVYLKTVQLKSDIYKNQPMNPMDKAVFWIEHVLKHKGAKHLKTTANKLAWYQYMLIDVLLFLGLIALIPLCVGVYAIKKIVACCRSKKCAPVKVKTSKKPKAKRL